MTERDYDPVTGGWFPRIESRPSEYCRAAAAFKAITGAEPAMDKDYLTGLDWLAKGRVKLTTVNGIDTFTVAATTQR